MSTRIFITALTIAASFAGSNTSWAEPDAPCLLEAHRVLTVKPSYARSPLGRAGLERLQGAEVEVKPDLGVTAEWLEARLKRRLRGADPAVLPACLTHVGHVHIKADSLGNTRSVTFIARDPGDAERVYHRVQRLIRGNE